MRLIVLIDEDEMDKMPENCENCILWEQFKNGEEYCVGMGHQRIFEDELINGKPDWCPLRPLPEKRNTTSLIETKHEAEENHVTPQHQAGFNLGWNACLDVITGGHDEAKTD